MKQMPRDDRIEPKCTIHQPGLGKAIDMISIHEKPSTLFSETPAKKKNDVPQVPAEPLEHSDQHHDRCLPAEVIIEAMLRSATTVHQQVQAAEPPVVSPGFL